LFGLFPLERQFADEKAPNKLGIPTEESFFKVIKRKSLLLRRGKDVANARPGLNVLRVSWIALYFPAQAVNGLP
jgi:hypothetical protein